LISVEYLAGFVDGEGSLSLARRRRPGRTPEYSLRVCVYNSDIQILTRIETDWGGVMSAVGQRHKRWKPGYALIWTNVKAATLIQAIRPYLRIKSNHAAALLEFQEHLRRCRRTRDSEGHLLRLSKTEL